MKVPDRAVLVYPGGCRILSGALEFQQVLQLQSDMEGRNARAALPHMSRSVHLLLVHTYFSSTHFFSTTIDFDNLLSRIKL